MHILKKLRLEIKFIKEAFPLNLLVGFIPQQNQQLLIMKKIDVKQLTYNSLKSF